MDKNCTRTGGRHLCPRLMSIAAPPLPVKETRNATIPWHAGGRGRPLGLMAHGLSRTHFHDRRLTPGLGRATQRRKARVQQTLELIIVGNKNGTKDQG